MAVIRMDIPYLEVANTLGDLQRIAGWSVLMEV